MRQLLPVLFFIFSLNTAAAQCFNDASAFGPGEYLSYSVYYKWGFINVNGARVLFSVSESTYKNRPVYSLYSYGCSVENLDKIFKVRDYFYAYLDKETLQPLWFERKNSEGGFTLHNTYVFDHSEKAVYADTQNSDEARAQDTLLLKPCTFDALSLAYYMRSVNFAGLNVNDIIPLQTILYSEYLVLNIGYLGKETVTTQKGEIFNCLKFSTQLPESSLFKGGEDFFVYVTDDANHLPVLVEAKLVIGSVKVYLDSYRNIKNPLSSKTSIVR